MKQILIVLLSSFLFVACTSKDDTAEPEVQPVAITPEAGKIKYKQDGKDISYSGSGYILENDFSCIKWENTKEQLSIDFYDMVAKTYTVSRAARAKGSAKIYYYPDKIASSNTMYISKSGTFIVTSFSTTVGFKVSGTFSASLEKSVNGTFTDKKWSSQFIKYSFCLERFKSACCDGYPSCKSLRSIIRT